MRTDFCRREVVNNILHIYTIRLWPCQFVR
jgi:hypothetical protein